MTTSKKINNTCLNDNQAKALHLIATGFGLGYMPYSPAAFGSIPGIILFFVTRNWPTWIQISLFILFLLGALGLTDRIYRTAHNIDINTITVDETMGMWAALLLIWRVDLTLLILAFLIFRLFDKFKPFPINIFEILPGGVGLMADDIAAGMITNIILRIVLFSGILA